MSIGAELGQYVLQKHNKKFRRFNKGKNLPVAPFWVYARDNYIEHAAQLLAGPIAEHYSKKSQQKCSSASQRTYTTNPPHSQHMQTSRRFVSHNNL